MDKKSLSTIDIARLLGISRVAVFKKIKAGEIKAEKAGRNYVITRESLPEILGNVLSPVQKRTIEVAVGRTVREYGETLRLLGKE